MTSAVAAHVGSAARRNVCLAALQQQQTNLSWQQQSRSMQGLHCLLVLLLNSMDLMANFCSMYLEVLIGIAGNTDQGSVRQLKAGILSRSMNSASVAPSHRETVEPSLEGYSSSMHSAVTPT